MYTPKGRKPVLTTNDAAFWAENSRVQREVLAEIAERRAAGIVSPEPTLGLATYDGPWADAVKAEIGLRGAARVKRNLSQTPGEKKRAAAVVRRAARLAKCYPYLTLKAKKAAEVAERKAKRAAEHFPYPTAKAKKAAEREARRISRLSNPIYAWQSEDVMAVSR